MHRVFVYGTLKKGNPIRGLDKFAGTRFLASTTTANANWSMIDLGAFPAVLPDGDHRISGELWEVDHVVFQELDLIEGYPDFYTRSRVETAHGNAWMYHFETADHTSVGEGSVHYMGDSVIWDDTTPCLA